jgi:hypothetical protein
MENCYFGFYTCGNKELGLCSDCEDGSNYEYFQDANSFNDKIVSVCPYCFSKLEYLKKDFCLDCEQIVDVKFIQT